MSLNIQIGNSEVVNLLVVQRVAELELEIEAKSREREQLRSQIETLREELNLEIKADITKRYSAKFVSVMEALCEFHDEFADWSIGFYSLSLSEPHGNVKIFVAIETDDDGNCVDINGVELSDCFEAAAEGLQLQATYTVPEAKRAAYNSLIKQDNAAYRYIAEREAMIADRDEMASKLLAAFTAKTLAANPEHYANVLAAVQDVAGGHLYLGTSPIGVTVDGTVVEESEDQTSGD